MLNIPLRDIMTSPSITIYEDEPLSKVWEKLRVKGVRHVPVIDRAGRIVGLMSERDLFRTLSPRVNEDGDLYYDETLLNSFILKHVMTHPVVTMAPEDQLVKAVEIMGRNKYGCIPLVDADQKVVGIVTDTDVLKWLAKHL